MTTEARRNSVQPLESATSSPDVLDCLNLTRASPILKVKPVIKSNKGKAKAPPTPVLPFSSPNQEEDGSKEEGSEHESESVDSPTPMKKKVSKNKNRLESKVSSPDLSTPSNEGSPVAPSKSKLLFSIFGIFKFFEFSSNFYVVLSFSSLTMLLCCSSFTWFTITSSRQRCRIWRWFGRLYGVHWSICKASSTATSTRPKSWSSNQETEESCKGCEARGWTNTDTIEKT